MTASELNAHIEDGSINEVMRVAEARQRKILSKIADDIVSKELIGLVLVSGGSSAGKTTTAKRLCTQLRVNEREAIHISTDDYFVGDKRNPRDENGEFDYEHVECVDIPRLAADIGALLKGETIPRRRFDFLKHEPYYGYELISLPKGGIIVLEGIHSLNPRLTEGIEEDVKYRLLVDAPVEARFLRRMVRDNHYRKIAPFETVKMWPKVLAGEEKWIKPFQDNADVVFDSYLVYEAAVLKFYVSGLLERIRHEQGEVKEVMDMIERLNPIMPIDATNVPGDSILRETIGDSQLEY